MEATDLILKYRALHWSDDMPESAEKAYTEWRATGDQRLAGFIVRCIRAHWIARHPAARLAPDLFGVNADTGLEAMAQSCVTGGAAELNRIALERAGLASVPGQAGKIELP